MRGPLHPTPVLQADEVSIYSYVSTQWDVPDMTWTKLHEEARRRNKAIIYWAVRNPHGEQPLQLKKFHMAPNGKTFCYTGGIWNPYSMYIEYGAFTRRFLNYWLAWAYQLRLQQAHEEVK